MTGVESLDDLVARIPDGASVAVAADYSGCAMEAVRALIRRGARDLELICVPQAGFQADMLIGAGCVARVETSGVTLGEYGQAPRFREAVSKGLVTIRDSTCPAIHAGLQAAEKGVPFLPLRGILGSDVQAHRDDWRVIDNPFTEDDPILLLPAIQPDVALFHAAVADHEGNVWIGVRRELMMMAHAARQTLVTVEEITDDDLLADDRTAAGTIPALYVTAVAEVPEGAWPIGLRGCYPADADHLRLYADMARTADGFEAYLDEHVLAGVQSSYRPEELLITTIAGLLEGANHVAVGAISPIPGAAALLVRERSRGRVRVSLLESVKHNFFTDGGRELFDCAGQGRIDAFFLGGQQIDGAANINRVGVGGYPRSDVRFPGTFGSAYLYFLVPRVILFQPEHTTRTLVSRVDFVSAPGVSPPGVYRPGGPVALVTGRCVFRFDRDAACFSLASVHPGETVAGIRDNTGFDFDLPEQVATTAEPDAETLALLRGEIADALAETYPEFTARVLRQAAG